MTACIICSLGTSLANGCPELHRLQSLTLGWDDHPDENCTEATKLQHYLDSRTHELTRREVSKEVLRRASAELNVLLRRPKQVDWKGIRIVLLATDTWLGRQCGEALARILETATPGAETHLVQVEGLQVRDGTRLRNEGIVKLLEAMRREIEVVGREGAEVTILPNGGYKGIVPFLTLMGMFYRCRVLYIFEFAETPSVLPALPFTLDLELYGRAAEALRTLDEQVEMPEASFLQRIRGYRAEERELFMGFVLPGETPGSVTPNPLLEALVEAAAQTPTVMLSPKALEDLEACGNSAERRKFLDLLRRSQEPTWREGHLHSLETTDLLAIKRVGSSPERLLGYEHEGCYYVARILLHDEYDRVTTGKTPKKKDFPLDCFTPYRFTPDDCAEAERADAEARHAEALRESEDKAREMEEMLNQTMADCEELKAALQQMTKVRDALQKETEQLRTTKEMVDNECAHLRTRLEELSNRSFFARFKALFCGK